MTTIPLEPIFENERFNELTPAAQYYLIRAVYTLLQKRKLTCIPDRLRTYFLCSVSLYNVNSVEFKAIIHEVAPKIIQIKNMKNSQSLKARTIMLENRAKLKYELNSGKLAEPIQENSVPIMPQFSALSEKLHRERQLMPIPKPLHRQNERKPTLTEKPKT